MSLLALRGVFNPKLFIFPGDDDTNCRSTPITLLENRGMGITIHTNSQKLFNLSGNEIFDSYNSDINWRRVHYACFGSIPNVKLLRGINLKRTLMWFETCFSEKIVNRHSIEDYDRKGKPRYEDVAYVLDMECIVRLERSSSSVEILYSVDDENIRTLVNAVLQFRKRIAGPHINVLINEMGGLGLRALKLRKPECSVEQNYNDDLGDLHDTLVQKLRRKGKSGLTLLHGIPGTGKSTYLRHLITLIKRKVIFFPPGLARSMDNPEIIELITHHPGSIVVIEDAEDLLVSRNAENNSSISMLLNLSDGLLGDSLGVQFICTFNTDLKNIDDALLRKGRLTALYEFRPLSEIKSGNLLRHLGITNYTPDTPMTLADIYYLGEHNFGYAPKVNPIGFGMTLD